MEREKPIVSVTTPVLFLVAGVSIESARGAACRRTDRRAFKAASGLMADDAASRRSEQSSGGYSALGVWARRGSAVGEGNGGYDAEGDWNDGFHGILGW